MSKNMEVAFLFDFYGDMLTEKQRELAEWYYDDDLTLSEIAENTGVTRQAVRDALTRTEAALESYEERLGLLRKTLELRKLAGELPEPFAARLNAILDEA